MADPLNNITTVKNVRIYSNLGSTEYPLQDLQIYREVNDLPVCTCTVSQGINLATGSVSDFYTKIKSFMSSARTVYVTIAADIDSEKVILFYGIVTGSGFETSAGVAQSGIALKLVIGHPAIQLSSRIVASFTYVYGTDIINHNLKKTDTVQARLKSLFDSSRTALNEILLKALQAVESQNDIVKAITTVLNSMQLTAAQETESDDVPFVDSTTLLKGSVKLRSIIDNKLYTRAVVHQLYSAVLAADLWTAVRNTIAGSDMLLTMVPDNLNYISIKPIMPWVSDAVDTIDTSEIISMSSMLKKNLMWDDMDGIKVNWTGQNYYGDNSIASTDAVATYPSEGTLSSRYKLNMVTAPVWMNLALQRDPEDTKNTDETKPPVNKKANLKSMLELGNAYAKVLYALYAKAGIGVTLRLPVTRHLMWENLGGVYKINVNPPENTGFPEVAYYGCLEKTVLQGTFKPSGESSMHVIATFSHVRDETSQTLFAIEENPLYI
ncbi:MAG: hypothetical protein WC910_07130 [Bacteroidales bacterium]|jgi:hypothetical protein